jgi:hypothetical protein
LTYHSIKLGNGLSLAKYQIFENNLIGQYFVATTFFEQVLDEERKLEIVGSM